MTVDQYTPTPSLFPESLYGVTCERDPSLSECEGHIHMHGHCTPWCLWNGPRHGAPTDEHGAYCYGSTGLLTALDVHLGRREVAAQLVQGYANGIYRVGVYQHLNRDQLGPLVRLTVTAATGNGGEVDEADVYLTPAEARKLSLVLQRLADRGDGLDLL